jgi:hypothetical protein
MSILEHVHSCLIRAGDFLHGPQVFASRRQGVRLHQEVAGRGVSVRTEGEQAAGAHLNVTRGDQWDFSKPKVSISRRSHACTSPHKAS